jgi:DNA-binding winged helix-turn-helix (wHTH) protein
MPDNLLIYEFANLRFSPFHSTLENTETGKKIKITPTHVHFLMVMIEKSPDIAEYDELRRKIWVQYAEMSESLKHLIQETKSSLLKQLKNEKFPADFIESAAGKGYRLKFPVKTVPPDNAADDPFAAPELPFGQTTALFDETRINSAEVKIDRQFTAYKLVVSFFYGLLFWLTVMLETAYQFDRYRAAALLLGLPLIAWNGGVMFAALSAIERFSLKNDRSVFMQGTFVLVLGTLVSCLAMLFFLPFEAITLARFQTQPAFAAFLKNALIYFLPLGIFYLLTPLYFISRAKQESFLTLLPNLFGFLFLALIYSLFSTFYLLDNLLPSSFHGLFVTLVFLRFIIYFGLGTASLLWAKSAAGTDSATSALRLSWRTFLFFGLLAVGLGFFMTADRNFKRPNLNAVEVKTPPDSARRMFVNIYGANFESEAICIRVIGEGCPESAPCLVPNGALQKHSIISENQLENVPLTLASGEFRIFVQNGDSPLSNGVMLNVP